MSKNNAKKTIQKSPRVYFISNNPDEDLIKIKSYFEKNQLDLMKFFDKVYKTTINTKETSNNFINIKMNIELNEEDFKQVSKKYNKILDKSYKMFYSDNNNRFVYIPENVLNDMNNSLNMFINDD